MIKLQLWPNRWCRRIRSPRRRKSLWQSLKGWEPMESRRMLAADPFPYVQSISLVGSSPSTGTSVSWNVKFSETVAGVDASDFALVVSGVTATLPLAVTGSGATYTVTANKISGSGTIGLNLVDDGTIRDQANNPLTTPNAAAAFAPQVTFATGVSTGGFDAVTVGDLNGDGKPDLAVANFQSDSVSVLLNTTPAGAQTPTYTPPASFATATAPSSVSIGDLNGDGKPDLAIGNFYYNSGGSPETSSSTVNLLLNTTATASTAPTYVAQQVTFTAGARPRFVSLADLNGDGKVDLVIAHDYSKCVSVLLNTTTTGSTSPSFGGRTTFATGSSPKFVAIGDLNGDGKLDLAVANASSSSVSVLLNTTATGGTTPSYAAQTTFATGGTPQSVSIGDLNGDGKPDLTVAITSGGSDSVSVLLNTTASPATTPSFAAKATFASTYFSTRSGSLGDFNGDGKPDIVLVSKASDGSAVSVLLNKTTTGATTPSFATPTQFSAGSSYSVAVGDVNGDGKPDVAVANASNCSVGVLLNQNRGGFVGAVATIVDPFPYAVGSIAATYEKYPNARGILPAMGYGDEQVAELERTIEATPCDVVVVGTPIDLTRVLKIRRPAVRARYVLRERTPGLLEEGVRLCLFGKFAYSPENKQISRISKA
ncbi:MAG: FG-GAP-like repeat-containing protein [Planctomycetota bacterium]